MLASNLKKILLTVLLLSIALISSGQRLGLDILYGKQVAELPFKLENGFIIVKVHFNNTLPLKFIFDTGAEHSILFHKAYADLLGVEYSKRIEIRGSDMSTSQYALIARDISMRLEDQIPVKRDVLVLEESLQLFQESLGFDIDGIIGGSFFRGLVVHFDYGKEKIRFFHPEKFIPPKRGYTVFDITVKSNKPYFVTQSIMSNNDTLNTKLLIDTGAAIPFLLHANTDSSIVIPEFVIKGTIGQGLSGNLMGYVGKINELKFGKFQFRQILTLFQDIGFIRKENITLTRNGIIGNELLSRFSIYIDYLREKIYMKAEKKYNDDFEYDKSGLIVFAFGPNLRQFFVKEVFENTPAFEADIRSGDVIKRIGIWKDRSWTLSKISKLMQKKDGKTIRMVIERNGTKLKKRFKLRDFFKESP